MNDPKMILAILNSPQATSWATILLSAVLAFYTFVLAKHTKQLFLEARKTRIQSIAPYVIITAIHDEERPSVIMLVIKNIGNGLALDISFSFSTFPQKSWGISDENIDIKPFDRGPLKTGIPALGPGEVRKIDWGQCAGIEKTIGDASIKVDITFFDKTGKQHKLVSKIDIASFFGTTAHDPTSIKAAKALESIAKALHKEK